METKQKLEQYAAQYETAGFIQGDPSWFMHQVGGADNQELMAWIASAFSYGRREQFMQKVEQILRLSGGDVVRWVREGRFEDHFRAGDKSSYYRLYSHADVSVFLNACRDLIIRYGSLKRYVVSSAVSLPMKGIEAVEALCSFFAGYGCKMVPKDTTSACKRVCMFLRWMVRDNSPVDIGLWSDIIERRTLIMPLDTHVLSQSVRLGLTSSRCASMAAAQKLTAALACYFPDDPVKGDFALFGYGVNN